jgi:AcrR family transcriptional regulator
MPTIPKPLRADARRNREKIVVAAQAAFAQDGLETQMDAVARRAEVGVGTLYRHFPTKDALLAAIVEVRMARMAAIGREIAAAPSGDAFADFASYVRRCAEHHVEDRALSQVTATQPPGTFRQAAESTGLIGAVDLLLSRAKAAGAVRADARTEDVGLVMCGLSAVLQSWGPQFGPRYVELVLDGLRRA